MGLVTKHKILVNNCNYLIRHKNVAELWKNYIPFDEWRIDGFGTLPFIVLTEDDKKVCVPVRIPVHENEKPENLLEELNTGKLVLTALGLSKPNPTNPVNCGGMTLLHFAAKKGYLNVCKLIAENVQEKNPEDCFGVTQLQLSGKKWSLSCG